MASVTIKMRVTAISTPGQGTFNVSLAFQPDPSNADDVAQQALIPTATAQLVITDAPTAANFTAGTVYDFVCSPDATQPTSVLSAVSVASPAQPAPAKT